MTGDLLAHCIDTRLWLNGAIGSVCAMTETFVKERKHNLTGKVEPVSIDDACAFLCRFENGSLGLFESTRYARGHKKALYTFEINGEKASLKWDLHDLHRLQYFTHADEGNVRGWRSIHVTDGDHPYMKNWWVPGLQIGYEHTFIHQVADFLENLSTGQPTSPTFREALSTQAVCDAVLDSAEAKEVGERAQVSCVATAYNGGPAAPAISNERNLRCQNLVFYRQKPGDRHTHGNPLERRADRPASVRERVAGAGPNALVYVDLRCTGEECTQRARDVAAGCLTRFGNPSGIRAIRRSPVGHSRSRRLPSRVARVSRRGRWGHV